MACLNNEIPDKAMLMRVDATLIQLSFYRLFFRNDWYLLKRKQIARYLSDFEVIAGQTTVYKYNVLLLYLSSVKLNGAK